MKSFLKIATPYEEILEGKFTKDTFAANLWQIFRGDAKSEYTDSKEFFKRTYLTQELEGLLKKLEKRFRGDGDVDSIIQLQTPFGGGKTHSLIALYHRAKELKGNIFVFDGSALSPKEVIIWEEMERQLSGEVKNFKGKTPPHIESLKKYLSNYQPLLILIDEIVEYLITARAIKVNNTYLFEHILSFIRFLTDVVRMLDKTILFITYPSKIHYEEREQKIIDLLQERIGRVGIPCQPIRDEEIYDLINKRLFKKIDKKAVEEVVDEFVDYLEREKLFSKRADKIEYRDKFLKSFPFQPEVIDILYRRWGTFPQFQRTRGLLYLLAKVIYSLKEQLIPFIRLSDFNLELEPIRSFFIDIIGTEWNGVISQDITARDSAAKKVDRELPATYTPYKLGTKVATTIFLYSFSAGIEKGAMISEIKFNTTQKDFESSIIDTVISKLKDPKDPLVSLYLEEKDDKYFYTKEITLARALRQKIDSIKDEEINKEERGALEKIISREKYFKIYLFPEDSKDIPDTKELKLIILKDEKKLNDFLKNCGAKPRVYQNTLIFLLPKKEEYHNFQNTARERIAYKLLLEENTILLSEKDKKEIPKKVKESEEEVKGSVRNLYRIIYLPKKADFEEIDLGITTYGMEIIIDKEIYERLKSEGEIVEKLDPIYLQGNYLKNRDYTETKNILNVFYTVLGEIKIINDDVLKNCIKEGVKRGLFGIGELENQTPKCLHFEEDCEVNFSENEIIIKKDLCEKPSKIDDVQKIIKEYKLKIEEAKTKTELNKIKEEIEKDERFPNPCKEYLIEKIKEKEKSFKDIYQYIRLKLNLPTGKMSDLARIINFLQQKFSTIKIKVELTAKDGEITKSDYQDKVKEGLNQADIKIEEENIE
ncbi:MAG: AAA family ATPase [candidate division WOR-3 bacterium]